MALMLEVAKADGTVTRTALQSEATKVAAWPGGNVRIIDTETGKAPANLTAKRIGDSLVVENLPEGKTVEITSFYTDCSPAAPCALTIEPADGAAATTITQTTAPIATLGESQALMYGSASTGAPAAAGGMSAGVLLGGAAIAGLALAAGGGGGGGGGDGDDTTAPDAPVMAVVAGDNVVDHTEATAGVPVSGTAEPGSSVAVTWGSTTKNATADGSGNWSVTFTGDEIPHGAGQIRATATDAAGNASAAGTLDVTVDKTVPDTTAPDAPIIAAVTGDNAVDQAEATAGVPVSGTAEPGSSIAVTWGSTTKNTTADGSGNWSVDFTSDEIPDGAGQISATATDAANNTSIAGTVDVTVDKTGPDVTAPDAPVIAALAEGPVINATEAAAGIAVSGTAEPGSTVNVTWGSAPAKSATADGTGIWSVNFSGAEVPDDGLTTISATATDAASNTSVPGTLDVTVDTTANAPTAVAGPAGSVSGTADAGDTITMGGLLTTMADGAGNYQFGPGSLASGAAATVTATDANGNVSAAVPVTGSTYADVAGTAGDDVLVGGSAEQLVDGGAGNDILIGDAGGNIRNYQFDYWNGTAGGSPWQSVGSGAGDYDNVLMLPDARNGWTIGNTANTFTADPDGTPLVQTTGGAMQIVSNEISYAYPDDTGGGGRYFWDTVGRNGAAGATISQQVATSAGEQYTLSMQVSKDDYQFAVSPDHSENSSFQVWWNGALLATWDGVTETWSGTGPDITDLSPTRQSWTWNVTADTDSTALELRGYSELGPDTLTSHYGIRVDHVTLDAVAAAGDDVLVGGAGSDLLFGQGGDDVLYGGAIGDTATTADNVSDTFVYSLRADNGNDVIKDFQVGVDRIYLVDAIDTFGAFDTVVFDPVLNAHVSRDVGFGMSASGNARTLDGDYNLTFRDFFDADSPTQYLEVTDDGSGSVKLSFFGESTTGAATALGSVVLEGVAYGSGAGQFDSVEDLFGSGFTDPTLGTPAPVTIVSATMDGLNESLMVLPPV